MSSPRLVLGFHSTGTCPTQFAMDLARCMRYSGSFIPFALHEPSCYVDAARNKLVRAFLGSDGSHLLMLDVDISFEPHYPMQTLEILRAFNADVCYGNYALGNAANSIFGSPDLVSGEAAVLVKLEPDHVYTDVAAGGTGWVLFTREILERMQKELPGPWHWFPRIPTADGLDLRGEDISCGLRLWGMDPRPKVIATTHLVLKHLKTQAFVPEFQAEQAKSLGMSALSFPNPYENDPNMLVHANRVYVRANLTPEQEEAIRKEEENAKATEQAGPGPSPDSGQAPDQAPDAGGGGV